MEGLASGSLVATEWHDDLCNDNEHCEDALHTLSQKTYAWIICTNSSSNRGRLTQEALDLQF